MSRLDPDQFDPGDPLCKLLTVTEVMERTGRTRKTVNRWIKDGRLATVTLDNPPRTVAATGDVLELEQQMRAATKASKEAIAARGGRPGARPRRTLGTTT
jgi:hypothetical protein